MSEERLLDFAGDDREFALRGAAESMRAGEQAEVRDSILRDLAGPSSWRRAEALERLLEVRGVEQLLPLFSDALADEDHADRRNAARSALSVLASPSSPVCEQGIAELTRLVTQHPSNDVRLLAAAAVGESGNTRGRAALEKALSDRDPNVASAAAESLGEIGDCRATPVLMGAAEAGDFWLRAAAIVALGKLRDERALSVLGGLVVDSVLGAAAAAAIGEIGSPKGVDLLRPAFAAGPEPRSAAASAVAQIYAHHPGAAAPDWLRQELVPEVPRLMPRLQSGDDAAAARLLGIAATPEATDALLQLITDPDKRPIAAVGLEHLPAETRRRVVLERLPEATPNCRSLMLDILPPLRDEEAIRQVALYLGDSDPEVRAAAAKTLGSSEPDIVLDQLSQASQDPQMRLGVALAYGYLGSGRCEPLLRLLHDSDSEVRATAATSLGRCASVDPGVLVQALRSEDDLRAREAILGALGASGGASAVDVLSAALAEPNPSVRFAAARGLGSTGAGQALEPLLRALEDPVAEVRVAALIALGDLGDPRAASAVGAHMNESATDVRRTAIRSLDRLARPGGWRALATALGDSDAQVRLAAIDTLRRIGDPAALPALIEHADSESDPAAREATTRAIVELRQVEQADLGG